MQTFNVLQCSIKIHIHYPLSLSQCQKNKFWSQADALPRKSIKTRPKIEMRKKPTPLTGINNSRSFKDFRHMIPKNPQLVDQRQLQLAQCMCSLLYCKIKVSTFNTHKEDSRVRACLVLLSELLSRKVSLTNF